jgi:hypothetical protein
MLVGLTVPEIRRLLLALAITPARRVERVIAWSHWRRRRQWQAKRSHYRRRGHTWPQLPLQY